MFGERFDAYAEKDRRDRLDDELDAQDEVAERRERFADWEPPSDWWWCKSCGAACHGCLHVCAVCGGSVAA